MPAEKKKVVTHEIYKKIEKLYTNYGIDTSTMGDDEFERLIAQYSKNPEELNEHLDISEKHKDKYSDDVI